MCLDPSLLAGAFPKEVHGHGITLVPLDTLICVEARALPKQTKTMAACFRGAVTMLAEMFGPLNYPQAAHERKSLGATEVECVCNLKRLEPSHRSSSGSEARMPTARHVVAKIKL